MTMEKINAISLKKLNNADMQLLYCTFMNEVREVAYQRRNAGRSDGGEAEVTRLPIEVH